MYVIINEWRKKKCSKLMGLKILFEYFLKIHKCFFLWRTCMIWYIWKPYDFTYFYFCFQFACCGSVGPDDYKYINNTGFWTVQVRIVQMG
jgi:hypothetical protein